MITSDISRREFVRLNALGSAGILTGVSALEAFAGTAGRSAATLQVSTFDMCAVPPAGSYLAYDPMINSSDLSLRAKGLVLYGAGKPIVLCVFDWIGIANGSQDAFKQALAEAANTTSDRVAVHTIHQHDAPISDFAAEKALYEAGIYSKTDSKRRPQSFDSGWQRIMLNDLTKMLIKSAENKRTVTHVGLGKAPIEKIASNRRIVKNGKVGTMRGTACKDAALRSEPEGLIDPDLTMISLWENDAPIVVMSFYATHPQSYYLTKIANPDFPGIARYYRQLSVPDALHIHFNGAGGNIGAGKYNDGSHENRLILARRMAEGMERAWKSIIKYPVTADAIRWKTIPVLLPASQAVMNEIESRIKTADMRYLTNKMSVLVWLKRRMAGQAIDLHCLGIGKSRLLLMPGELFVEYQLAAKAMRPDLAVSMAAYGDYGPSYIGTKEAYPQGGYEIGASPVTGEVEEVLMKGIKELLTG